MFRLGRLWQYLRNNKIKTLCFAIQTFRKKRPFAVAYHSQALLFLKSRRNSFRKISANFESISDCIKMVTWLP